MATATVMYFNGDTQLENITSIPVASFKVLGGVASRHNSFDSFRRLAGMPANAPRATLPVTRKVFYKKRPSLHKCDARCMNAKGHDCECSCGGKNHGKNA